MQVYQRLQKLQLSHCQTQKVIDEMGEGFASKVVIWEKDAEETMKTEGVSSTILCGHLTPALVCIIGERERANLVVRTARFFSISKGRYSNVLCRSKFC